MAGAASKTGRVPSTATGVLVYGPELEAVQAAVKAKYGWQMTAIQLVGKLRALFSREDGGERCAIVVTLD